MDMRKFSLFLALIITLLAGCATSPRQADGTAPVKTSAMYKIARNVAAGTGQKKVFSLEAEEMVSYLEARKKPPLFCQPAPPAYITRQFRVTEKTFGGRPCYEIKPRTSNEAPEKSIFFIYGGGFIYEIMDNHWRNVKTLVDELAAPVWLPAYPLVPGATVEDMVF
ncbi:MAG: hypothetical protein LBQ38_12060, partial [Spirochaetaceae bacterium]|nr:hypothetical protein [Spirochaetaceae bacterium]